MINKLRIIIFSRFKKPKIESWVSHRRAICSVCEFNTKNIEKIPIRIKMIKFFSDIYSYMTGNKKVDVLGNCTACSICSIYYKTAESLEQCPASPKKWSSKIKK